MYLKIENDFQKNSTLYHAHQLLTPVAFLIAVAYAPLLTLIKDSKSLFYFYPLILASATITFCIIFYIFAFFNGIPKGKRNLKAFFKFSDTILAYRTKLIHEDIAMMQLALKQNSITTNDQIEHLLKHYELSHFQVAPQNNQFLSILTTIISIVSFVAGPPLSKSSQALSLFFAFLFIVAITYVAISFIKTYVYSAPNKASFYNRIKIALTSIRYPLAPTIQFNV